MKTKGGAEWFKREILRRKPGPRVASEYGNLVLPVLELYATLESHEERRAFETALEILLRSKRSTERSFAVNVCLGFYVFRDAIRANP